MVIGSTDTVGRLVARKLGQAGARVLVHGRDAKSGVRVVADIKAGGGAVDFLAAELSALSEIRRLADAAQATVDRLDILINNAGSAPLVHVPEQADKNSAAFPTLLRRMIELSASYTG